MGFRRRRSKRMSLGKDPRIMGKSLINTLLTNVPEISSIIVPTEFTSVVGTGTVFDTADTKATVSPNSAEKYINIKFELSSDQETAPANPGWFEYGLIFFDECEATPTLNASITANITTTLLGNLLRNLYRGNCIWTDTYPIQTGIPIAPTVGIKIPKKFVTNKRGRCFMIISNFRSINASESTSKCKVNYETMWKAYL